MVQQEYLKSQLDQFDCPFTIEAASAKETLNQSRNLITLSHAIPSCQTDTFPFKAMVHQLGQQSIKVNGLLTKIHLMHTSQSESVFGPAVDPQLQTQLGGQTFRELTSQVNNMIANLNQLVSRSIECKATLQPLISVIYTMIDLIHALPLYGHPFYTPNEYAIWLDNNIYSAVQLFKHVYLLNENGMNDPAIRRSFLKNVCAYRREQDHQPLTITQSDPEKHRQPLPRMPFKDKTSLRDQIYRMQAQLEMLKSLGEEYPNQIIAYFTKYRLPPSDPLRGQFPFPSQLIPVFDQLYAQGIKDPAVYITRSKVETRLFKLKNNQYPQQILKPRLTELLNLASSLIKQGIQKLDGTESFSQNDSKELQHGMMANPGQAANIEDLLFGKYNSKPAPAVAWIKNIHQKIETHRIKLSSIIDLYLDMERQNAFTFDPLLCQVKQTIITLHDLIERDHMAALSMCQTIFYRASAVQALPARQEVQIIMALCKFDTALGHLQKPQFPPATKFDHFLKTADLMPFGRCLDRRIGLQNPG